MNNKIVMLVVSMIVVAASIVAIAKIPTAAYAAPKVYCFKYQPDDSSPVINDCRAHKKDCIADEKYYASFYKIISPCAAEK